MATEQVNQWIQTDLRLSKPISNFETDFSNGYIFGEILVHYGIIPDMNSFTNKSNKEAKVNNFYKIEDALRRLKVRFDAKLIHNIMQEERGASLRLLYQLKLACDKHSKVELPNDPEMMSMTNIQNAKLHKVLDQRKELVLNNSKFIVPPTVGGKDMRSEKQKLLDQHTIAYEVNQKNLFDAALQDDKEQNQTIFKLQQEQRQINRQKLLENKNFMQEWEQEGQKNWQLNQTKREQAIKKVKYFEDREVTIWRNKLKSDFQEATSECIEGVSNFEKNLQKLGIEQFITMDEAIKKQEEKKGIPPGQIQNFSYAATMNKIKESKKNTDFAGKERERRKMKMAVDQVNAQAKLDQKRNEANLIAKLQAQTLIEQADAFTDIRIEKCKFMLIDNRKAIAETLESKRLREIEINEAKSIETGRKLEQQRRKEIEIQRIELDKVKKQQFAEKRRINVEIASGLIDLIMDLADETFQVVERDPNRQIQKADWRQFSSIFKAGKMVSLRNFVPQPPVDEGSANFDVKPGSQTYETCLSQLLEYLTSSGMFQLAHLKPDLWARFSDQFGEQLQSRLTSNQPLVDLIEQTLGENKNTVNQTPTQFQAQMPKGINFQVAILGQAFSGKKTLAKQLVEKLNGEVKILNMDEIIKEALDYINPKKVPDVPVVDPKAKGKAAQVQQVAPVDPFEGKDSTMYKKIATEIKQKFFPGDEIPQKCDLVELVLDDHLLTSLFLERLQLHYSGINIPERDIQGGLVREKEIVQQLEEHEAALAAAAADPKNKGKLPKGGPDPEKLKAELEDIRNFKPVGWILVDFPRTLSQAKTLESYMSGFKSNVDNEQVDYFKEQWHKLVVGNSEFQQMAATKVHQSAFDAYIFLDVPLQECLRRSKNRKIDPQTNQVYHMQDNPPEVDPKDAKMLDRLQDYVEERADERRIKRNCENFEKSIESIKTWCHQFGLCNENGVEVSLNQEVVLQNDLNNKSKIKEAFLSQINQVLRFKQNEFTNKRKNPIQQQVPQTNNEEVFEEVQPPQQTKTSAFEIGGTSSQGGTTTMLSAMKKKQMQRVYQIQELEKVKRWKDVTAEYFKSNITSFYNLYSQRGRLFNLLNETQQKFIDFLQRPNQMQKKIQEFCDNFNRFSQEYPELRKKEETKTELLKRVEILNKSLWEMILQRKNESIEEKQNIMQGGWSTSEKNNLCCFISQIIDLEFQRFHGCVNMAIGWVFNEDLDLTGLCKKMVERGVEAYDGSRSPIMDNVISYALNTMNTLMQEQFMNGLDQQSIEMIKIERQNFNLRVNTLKVYAVLLLEEIVFYSNQVFDQLDSWIVKAVKRENTLCQNAVQTIKAYIGKDTQFMESLELNDGKSLSDQINQIQFKEVPPRYIQEKPIMSTLFDLRLDIQNLKVMYNQFRENSTEYMLDQQTFVRLMVQNYQARIVPKTWTQESFLHLLSLCESFNQAPLQNQKQAQILFAEKEAPQRLFVNWQQIFTLMLLSSAVKPNSELLDIYCDKLGKYGEMISLEDFLKVESWFDQIEAANSESRLIKANSRVTTPKTPLDSESEEEQDVLTNPRLIEVKTLIFLTNKTTNERNLRIANLRKVFEKLNEICADCTSYGEIISK